MDGQDVNLEQLRDGSAWVYTQCLRELTKDDRSRYLEAEKQARSDALGLWQDRQPQPPWEWRRAKRMHRGSNG